MARLIDTAITSLDGYVADADGSFDWAAPDEEVHAFVDGLERPCGTYLHGRRTRLVRSVDPAAVRRLTTTAEQDLSVGGPGLAAHAIRAARVIG